MQTLGDSNDNPPGLGDRSGTQAAFQQISRSAEPIAAKKKRAYCGGGVAGVESREWSRGSGAEWCIAGRGRK